MKIHSFFSLREVLSIELGHRLVTPKQGDRYLVSYPRSGNTWMRTMLGILINPQADGNPDFTRKNIPGITIRNAEKINKMSGPRIIKSHTWFRPEIKKAIYLIRDGRDVIVSLYHYYITREDRRRSFPDFIKAYLGGKYGPVWQHNVISWLTQGRDSLGEDLLVIKFEDLKMDPHHQLKTAAMFLDLPYNEDRLAKAIEVSDINRMRKIELERRGPIQDLNASFYRGGKTGEWRNYFTPDLEAIYLEQVGKAMKLAGYLD